MTVPLAHSFALSALIFGTTLASSTAAFAQAPTVASQDAGRRFGRAGQVVINAGQAFSIQRMSAVSDTGSSYAASIPVGAFVTEHILVSLTPSLSWGKQRYRQTDGLYESTSRSVSLAPTVAWNVVIDERFSLLPTASFGMGWSRRKHVGTGEDVSQNDTSYSGGLSMPLLFHPGPHMFFGLGPSLSVSRSRYGEQRQTYVLFHPVTFTMGGWF